MAMGKSPLDAVLACWCVCAQDLFMYIWSVCVRVCVHVCMCV